MKYCPKCETELELIDGKRLCPQCDESNIAYRITPKGVLFCVLNDLDLTNRVESALIEYMKKSGFRGIVLCDDDTIGFIQIQREA